MDFHLTREQELVRQMMHDFTENEVKPIAAETDKTSTYPRENIEKLFDLGVMGMIVPEEFGGAGADDLSSAIAIEELSKQCASTGDILATHNGLCCGPIIANGTPEQKEKYLRMLTEGHKVGAFALTEPDAGSDAAKGTCVAELQGDHYVLNGSKIFITNGYVADVFVVFAMTDKSKGTRGISAFIVESSFPGFSVGKHEEKLGLHGSPTAEIVFTDCIVPKENLLGAEGKGFKIAMQTLDGGEVRLTAPVTITDNSNNIELEKDVTLDLNGQTLDLSAISLWVPAGVSLTVKDSEGSGEIQSSVSIIYNQGGNIRIEGGALSISDSASGSCALYQQSGEMTITGGTFTGTAESAALAAMGGTICIEDGIFEGPVAIRAFSKAKITMTGGELRGSVVQKGSSEIIIGENVRQTA